MGCNCAVPLLIALACIMLLFYVAVKVVRDLLEVSRQFPALSEAQVVVQVSIALSIIMFAVLALVVLVLAEMACGAYAHHMGHMP